VKRHSRRIFPDPQRVADEISRKKYRGRWRTRQRCDGMLRESYRNISGSMNFQDYFRPLAARCSLLLPTRIPGDSPRNTPARMRSISRTDIDPRSLDSLPLSSASLPTQEIRDSSGSALLIGLWKCYDKNIVDRASVDFPHFYWPALIDFAFEGPLAAAMTNVKFRSSAFHRDPT